MPASLTRLYIPYRKPLVIVMEKAEFIAKMRTAVGCIGRLRLCRMPVLYCRRYSLFACPV